MNLFIFAEVLHHRLRSDAFRLCRSGFVTDAQYGRISRLRRSNRSLSSPAFCNCSTRRDCCSARGSFVFWYSISRLRLVGNAQAQFEGRAQVAFRKGEFLTANVDQSEFGIWLGRRRLGLDALRKRSAASVRLSSRTASPSEVQVSAHPRLGPGRHGLHFLARSVELIGIEICHTQGELSARIGRVGVSIFLEVKDGLVGILLLEQHCAERVVVIGVVGIQTDCFFQRLLGFKAAVSVRCRPFRRRSEWRSFRVPGRGRVPGNRARLQGLRYVGEFCEPDHTGPAGPAGLEKIRPVQEARASLEKGLQLESPSAPVLIRLAKTRLPYRRP